MRSRIGKRTEYDFAILREVDLPDMVKQHRRYMHKMEARGPYMYQMPRNSDGELQAESQLDLRDPELAAKTKSKTDLNQFVKKFTQQKAMIFTQKPKLPRQPSEDRISQKQLESNGPSSIVHSTIKKDSAHVPSDDDGSVDIEAQVQAAKALLTSI